MRIMPKKHSRKKSQSWEVPCLAPPLFNRGGKHFMYVAPLSRVFAECIYLIFKFYWLHESCMRKGYDVQLILRITLTQGSDPAGCFISWPKARR